MQNPEKNWFGEKEIKDGEKTDLVRGVFDSVAPKYDIMNDLMSAGIHRLWKRRLISQIRPRKGKAYLDVAGGTGDIAFRIRESIGEKSDITLCDINDEMLEVGQQRAINRGWLMNLNGSQAMLPNSLLRIIVLMSTQYHLVCVT